MGDELIHPSAATLTYPGQRGKTRRRPWHIGCECGLSFVAEVYEAINLADGEDVVRALLTDEVDRAACPHCGRSHVPELARTVHDPRLPLFVLWLPPSLRSRELELRAELLLDLAAEPCAVPEYVKSFRLVFGATALHALLDAGARRSAAPVPTGGDSAEGRAALCRERDALGRARRDLEVDRVALRALAADLALRRRVRPELAAAGSSEFEAVLHPLAAARPPATEEGWGRDGARVAACLQPGRPGEPGQVVLALRPGSLLSSLRVAPPQVLVQLCRGAHQPLMVLTVLPEAAPRTGDEVVAPGAAIGACREMSRAGRAQGAASNGAERTGRYVSTGAQPQRSDRSAQQFPDRLLASGAAADEALAWCCDPGDPAASAVLERLARDFVVELDLYDDEARPLASWQVRAPLAENVAEALRRARALRASGEVASGSLAEAKAACVAAGGVGGSGPQPGPRHELSVDAFLDAPSPGVARLALGLVGYWAEAAQEERLLWQQSFPLRHWNALRLRVLAHARRYGLLPSEPLLAFGQARGLWGSTRELLPELLRRFVPVSQRQEPSDLDPFEEWENWQALLAACRRCGLPLAPELSQLTADSARRARERVDLLDLRAAAEGGLVVLSTGDLPLVLVASEPRGDGALPPDARDLAGQDLDGRDPDAHDLDEQDIVDQEELLGDADIVDTRWLEDRTPAALPGTASPGGVLPSSAAPEPPGAAPASAPVLDVRDDDIVERTPVLADGAPSEVGPETR